MQFFSQLPPYTVGDKYQQVTIYFGVKEQGGRKAERKYEKVENKEEKRGKNEYLSGKSSLLLI